MRGTFTGSIIEIWKGPIIYFAYFSTISILLRVGKFKTPIPALSIPQYDKFYQ